MPSNDPAPGAAHASMAERAARSGIQRILVLGFRDLEDPAAGGSELHAEEVGTHFARAGLDVVHHTGRVEGAPEEVHRSGVRVVRRGGRVGVFARTPLDHRSGRLGPTDGIIEVFHGLPFFSPIWARHVPQVGLIHNTHLGAWHHLLPWPAAMLGHALERVAVPVAYRRRPLVTIAESTRDEIVRAYGGDAGRIRVVPSGVHPRFAPGGERAAQPLIVSVARLMPQKGIADMLAVLAAVRRSVPEATLVVVGEGPERQALEQRAVDLGIDTAVQFVGRVSDDELVGWYRRAWVVASASTLEGFGLTLTEAGGCGTPSVARRMTGHVDAVVDGVTGLLAEGVDGIAATVVRVLQDPVLRDRLGRGAADHAGTLRWEHTASRLLDVLCDVADGRS